MDLRARLQRSFGRWSPAPPAVVSRGSREVALVYSAGVFSSVDGLLYVVQRKEKSPPWVTVYSGGKTTTTIRDLAPAHPHRFRLKVIIRGSAVEGAGGREEVLEAIEEVERNMEDPGEGDDVRCAGGGGGAGGAGGGGGDAGGDAGGGPAGGAAGGAGGGGAGGGGGAWLESRWSGETWSSTDSEGTTAACFCMAVRCRYLLQVQQMLDERPELVSVVNNSTGWTPLATAARRGDTVMVRQLVQGGAEVDQRSWGGRTALQLAAAHAHPAAVDALLASGADFTCRDVNSMRVEHFAVDSGDLATVRLVVARGDVAALDSNGWTPLFRAVVQGASAEIVKELLERGSDVNVTDRRGLTLAAAARLLRGRLGKGRDSILKLVDSQYQHEKVLANFTRITKKISSIQTLLTRK